MIAKRRLAVLLGSLGAASVLFFTSLLACLAVTNGHTYRLISVNSTLVADVDGASTSNGAIVHQWTDNSGPQQEWTTYDLGNGYWRFVNVNSGKSMEVGGYSTALGGQIQQWDWVGHNWQQWSIQSVGDGSFKIVNRGSGLLMDVEGDSLTAGANIHQWSDLGNSNQHWLFQDVATEVYIGGGDTSAGAFDGYLGDPNGWQYVRAHAAGYYINNFALNPNTGDSTQNSKLQQMANLFANKNVFYETDEARSTDFTDEVQIDILRQFFNGPTYATLNDGWSADRLTALEWRAPRPILAMQGPWAIGGDINANNTGANYERGAIDAMSGSSTDGPMGLWANNTGDMHDGSYSMVKYSHNHAKIAMCMLAPYQSGSGANFLADGQDCVRGHENNGARPDVWVVSYYAAQLEQYPVTPESNPDGSAAGTVTGMAYWLLNHINDPSHFARLILPKTKLNGTLLCSVKHSTSLSETARLHHTGALPREATDIDLSVPAGVKRTASRTVHVELLNESKWLDLCPVLYAHVDDPRHQWTVHFTMGGKDITNALVNEGGFVFVKNQRLWPNANKDIAMTVSCKTGSSGIAVPASVRLGLMAHPWAADKVNETMSFHMTVHHSPRLVSDSRISG